jgi:putative FmdB family regulatory protein
VPTYEYECGECQHHFERKQKFDEEPIAMCPKCRSKARRVIHSAPIIFKGSGFYITDSRGSSSGSSGTSGTGASEKKAKGK